VKDIMPPLVLRTVGLIKTLGAGRFRFAGPYATWEEAASRSTGYDATGILERVREATRQVTRGEAAFERDSITFRDPEHPYPLLAVLLRAAIESYGRLSVLDYGGSLGSVYYQCRTFLRALTTVRWSVVEQPAFVECGMREFQTDELRFYPTVEESVRADRPDVALLSSVLQYLPDPYAISREIASAGPRYIVIDRTPVHEKPDDAIVVQHVPASIYAASYPCRIFSRQGLSRLFGDDYLLFSTFESLKFEALERALNARYEGLVFQKRDTHHPLSQP
jgi:putative methyltransferase (TIGR04325 family)